jgi:hypothetical protein
MKLNGKELSVLLGAAALQALIVLFIPVMNLVQATTVGVELLEKPGWILVTPSSASTIVGNNVQFTATAQYSSGSPDLDVTSDPYTTWSTVTPAVATVNATGLAKGVGVGTTEVRATYGGVTGAAALAVGSATPPPPPKPPAGGRPPAPPPPPPPEEPPEEPEEPPEEPEEPPEEPEEPPEEPEEPPEEPEEPPEEQPPAIPPEEEEEEAPPEPEEEEEVEEEVPPEEEPEEQPPAAPEQPPVTPPGEEPETPSSSGEPDLQPPEEEEQPRKQVVSIESDKDLKYLDPNIEYEFISPELSVTRGEILEYALYEFDVIENKKALVDACVADLENCLSIFVQYTKYEDVKIDKKAQKLVSLLEKILSKAYAQELKKLYDLGATQLYPDVPPDLKHSYAINIATFLSIIHGYYQEPQSPFKPYQVVTRIEALKILLGTTDMVEWYYYDELETILGGADAIALQVTPFSDVFPKTMWWYPRYINNACKIKMIDCTAGSKFRPDDYITDAELEGMIEGLKKYLDESDYIGELISDPDKDGIPTYLEDSVYRTDYLDFDTDDDGLSDGEEVALYKTNPLKKDSDSDGVSDYEEVITHNTNPLNPDSDGDDFTDGIEVAAGSDPLDAESVPEDADNNNVEDSWEIKYNIKVIDGTQDTDRDGVSDKLEYQAGTDPTIEDTDGDGYSDAIEILEMNSDPLDPSDPGVGEEVKVRITNFIENQLVGDTTPMIKGTAPYGATVRIVLRNDFGHEKVLGDTIADENNIFIIQVEEPVRDGRYVIVAKVLDAAEKKIIQSEPVHIVIDSTLAVDVPKPKKLDDEQITEDVLLKNVRVRVRNKRPVLLGETEYGSKVTATWRSLVVTSALIADSVTGEFEIEAPRELTLGQHEVYVTATRKKDNAQSETVTVLFTISAELPGLEEILREAAEGEVPGVAGFGAMFAEGFAGAAGANWFLIVLGVLVVAAVVGGAIYYIKLGKE